MTEAKVLDDTAGAPPVDETTQMIDVGAFLHIDELIMKHGIAFIRPGMPSFIMFFNINPETNVLDYRFEKVEKSSDKIKKLYFRDIGLLKQREEEHARKLLVPAKKKLILPAGNA